MQKLKKNLPVAAAVLVVVFGLLQFANPARTNPPVVHDYFAAAGPAAPAGHLADQLRASCYDCHSYETKWPWYAHIAPVSWLVVDDVNEGRKHLNFSDWPVDNPAKAAKKLGNISEQLEYRDMPPAKYTVIHRNAVLNDTDRQALKAWADAASARLKASP
jgi:Haem-binding domain